ncbi:hypothetical protein [Massilia aquatica]|nr:hypothetical protein [Massilia aquatica]
MRHCQQRVQEPKRDTGARLPALAALFDEAIPDPDNDLPDPD